MTSSSSSLVSRHSVPPASSPRRLAKIFPPGASCSIHGRGIDETAAVAMIRS